MAVAALAIGALGTIVSTIGGLKQASAAKKAEKAREQQMELDAMRRRRETLRQATVARAQALSNATAQGADTSSALAGGLAQVTNQAGRNLVAINQDEQLGKDVFKANRQAASGAGLVALGNGISSLGSAFSSNIGTLQRIGGGATI